MSYKYAVINNKPIGYWPMVFDTPSNSFKNYVDQTNPATPAAGSTEVITDIAPLISRHVGDNDFHACRVFPGTDITIPNIYNMAIKNYEYKNFSIEFWLLMERPVQEKNTLVSLKNDVGTKSLEIYAIQDNLYLEITGTSSHTIRKQIKNLFIKNHIYASYNKNIFTLSINGMSEETVEVDNSFSFANLSNSKFHVGPATVGNSYVVSDLAFYDRLLSDQEIKSHMFWATKDSEPMLTTTQGSTYAFNIINSNKIISYRKDFNNQSSFSEGYFNNIVYKDGGLTINNPATPSSGSWTYNFTPSTYDDSVGISISWDSAALESSSINSNSVEVSASYDNGTTFYKIKNGELFVPYISQLSDISSASLFVKVDIVNSGANPTYAPRLDNLSIKLYKSLVINSDSGGFEISPLTSTGYNIRKDEYNFLARSKNFGIQFNGSLDDYPSSAQISSSSSSPYEAIEFWFKYNGTGGGALLDTPDIAGDDLYIDVATNQLKWNLSAVDKIYVNGMEQLSQGYPIIVGEPYHVFIVYGAIRTSSIYLNKSIGNINSETNCVFGYISMYPTQISSTEVENRYISYLTLNSASINDINNSFGSIIEYSGNASSINSGFAVMAYDHIY